MNTQTCRSVFLAVTLFISGQVHDAHAFDLVRKNNKENRSEWLASKDQVTAFRFRSDFHAELDEDEGWGGAINKAINQTVDVPFRLRFEVEAHTELSRRRQYSLQYKHNKGPWKYMEAQDFPYPSAASPAISIIGCEAFFFGEEAEDLLPVSTLPSDPGAGICLAPTTPGWVPGSKKGASVEWEWALVIRHWTDGAQQVQAGDRFALRMVDEKGGPLSGNMPAMIVEVPGKHIGGTFVETPTRIGPYENSNGELYFIMEPAETDNKFMMIRSADGGESWREMNPDDRPGTGDLEGVGSVISPDGIIHMVHETSDYVYYHAFATSDVKGASDQWLVTDQIIAKIEEPPVQTADIALRPDGSLVVMYASGAKLQYSTLEPKGNWSEASTIALQNNGLTNPILFCRPDGVVEIVYKSDDGKGWNRQLLPDNTLTDPRQFADNLGTEEHESMAILPLTYLPGSKTLAVFFRTSEGHLYGRAKTGDGWSKSMLISDRSIVTNAVDSDQAGADVVAYDNKLYLTFIAEDDRDIYLAVLNDLEQVPSVTKLIPDVNGAWVRGKVLRSQMDSPCYGIIYDAGSKGGSGYNRFYSYPIDD